MPRYKLTPVEKAELDLRVAKQRLKQTTTSTGKTYWIKMCADAEIALRKAQKEQAEDTTQFSKKETEAAAALNTLQRKRRSLEIRKDKKDKQQQKAWKLAQTKNLVSQMPTPVDKTLLPCSAPTLHAVELCQCQKQDLPSARFEEIREIAQQTLAKKYLKHFVRQAWKITDPQNPLVWGDHVDAICFHIQNQLMDRWENQGPNLTYLRAQNILINIPPRSLKTTVLSFATVWAWLHEPRMSIMYLSSNPRVSIISARLAQTIVRSNWYKELVDGQWQLKIDHDALTSFGNTLGGVRSSRSLNGAITGEGADWLAIDDPHDVRDSESEIRATVDGYDSAVHNRINDPNKSIRTAVMQRFRADDFSGHLLETHGGDPSNGGWLHVRIPTEFTTNPQCKCGSCIGKNIYGWQDWRHKDGQIIHPRFTKEFLAEELRTKGPYGYAGQHQQEPAPPSGGMLKNQWYQWFKVPEDQTPPGWKRPHGCNDEPAVTLERKKNGKLDLDFIVISVDGTFGNTDDTKGSAVGLQLWGIQRLRKFLLDDQTEAIPYLDALDRIRRFVRRWAHEAPMRVLVEPKAFGPMAVEELRRDLRQGNLVDQVGRSVVVVVEVLKGPDGKGMAGDKVTRAHSATPTLAAGLVLLREGAGYVEPYVAEMSVFPNGKRDDRVDATTQVLNYYQETNDIAKARALLRR